jgi:asparagine synthase (glutamine-hydrolysing)
MCGINGFTGSEIVNGREVIQRMNDRLSHRGPNDEGAWHEGPATLGHRRLSIIDLSAAGHQPMISHCGRYVLVFNGEIYNYRELRQQIDYPYQSNSDSEVLLAAWSRYGLQTPNLLNGMFAFAIWDKQEEVMTLVRDRMGIKPLYWSEVSSGLVFSSEIRALLASGLVSSELSASSLVDYMRYQTVQSPDTILRDVKMLAPASILQYHVRNRKLTISRYWDICDIQPAGESDYGDVTRRVHELFYQAVEKRLVADVPFGAFLSGGIDSSAVVGAMAKMSSVQVKTFNISFAEEAYSEARYARYIAKIHGTDHHEIRLSPDRFLELLPDALKSMDHPSGDGPNTWVVSKVTKEAGIDMALSGLGGDEVFGGYAIFKRMAALNKYRALWQFPAGLRRGAGHLLTAVRPGVASSKMAALLSMPDYHFNRAFAFSRQVLMDTQIAGLLKRDSLPSHLPVEWLNQRGWNEDLSHHLLSRVSVAEMSTYMQNVLLRDSDQMSMAHALELRVPFLDHELIAYVLSLPDGIKYPSTPKKLLVDSLPELLPDYIVNRPKMGFVFPWSHWLKNELRGYADERLKHLAENNLFQPGAIMDLWHRFLKDDPTVTFSRIWPLVVLAEWQKTVVGR